MRVPGFLSNIRYLQGEAEEAAFIESLCKLQNDYATIRKKTTPANKSATTNSITDSIKDGLKKIRSKHPQVRSDGLQQLVDQNATAELTGLLGHSDPEVRHVAAVGVSQLRHVGALPYLIDGLRVTGNRRKHDLIPNAEDLLKSYGNAAFEPILSRIPKSFGYRDGKERWVRALANVADKTQACKLLDEYKKSKEDVFLTAAILSGYQLPKKSLLEAPRWLSIPSFGQPLRNIAAPVRIVWRRQIRVDNPSVPWRRSGSPERRDPRLPSGEIPVGESGRRRYGC
jgi:hypothetical protein